MILGKRKTVPEITPLEAVSSKGNGSEDAHGKDTKEQDATLWGNKGNAMVESSMYSEAIKCYDKALEINPNSMEAWNNKGLALARTGRLAEAIQCYDKALGLNSGDAEVMYNKGIALAMLGKSSEAVECYDNLLAINPGDADAWCSKGDVLFESGRFEEALQAYDKSIEIDPRDETTWNNRGMTLVKLKLFSKAIESYDKALEINPKVEKIWSNKGLAIAKMEESKSKVDLQKVAAALPKEDKTSSLLETKPAEQPNGVVARQECEPSIAGHEIEKADVNTLPPVEMTKNAPDTEASGHEPKAGSMGIEDAPNINNINNEIVIQPDDKPISIVETPVSSVKSIEQSGSDSFIEIAESIEKNKSADNEKNPPSLSGNQSAPGAGILSSGQSGEQPAIKEPELPPTSTCLNTADTAGEVSAQVPGNDPNTTPVIDASLSAPLNTRYDKPEPENEAATAGNPFSGQDKPEEQDSEIEPVVGKEDQNNINTSGNNLKCLVSVPIDAYIKNPCSNSHLCTEADIISCIQEPYTEPQCEKAQPVDNTASVSRTSIPAGGDNGNNKENSETELLFEIPDAVKPQDLKKSQENLVMGNTLYSLGKYEYAIESFDKSLQIDPSNNTAWNNKGLALGKIGKLDEAISCYDKALEINLADYIVLNNKGSALYKQGNLEEALKCYKSSLESNPGNKTAIHGVKICTDSINKSKK